ncbi:GNAT family N-acetyltransferase [Roseobacter sinensis]|uniref:GNAT family N-acetyltransferase n=1 Tax=Roseobacter sinensis TaxID=2931391 RepID=A0ABT3BM73_9RHOB|nr:GNAT family N-acetyltransferase [Roseobacter sp. WL0113]MCV3274349.1 GNAT family N-acetyltransferase [Roseobacter sp. WL0113]
MALDIRPLDHAELADHIDDVARLRIAVFRDWPYLYDGDLEYERRYLQPYLTSAAAIVVGAFHEGRLVGASTGAPLSDHAEDFAVAFSGSGLDLATIFYCAESVLLPSYRGQGAGHAFFDLREAHARRLGFGRCCFCAVIRPQDHPARAADYAPLDPFWRKRGYTPLEGVTARFSWKDRDAPEETSKALQFWMRDLQSVSPLT